VLGVVEGREGGREGRREGEEKVPAASRRGRQRRGRGGTSRRARRGRSAPRAAAPAPRVAPPPPPPPCRVGGRREAAAAYALPPRPYGLPPLARPTPRAEEEKGRRRCGTRLCPEQMGLQASEGRAVFAPVL